MSFTLDFTALIAVLASLSALAALLVIVVGFTGARSFITRNRAIRISRREPVFSYYAHLVTGH